MTTGMAYQGKAFRVDWERRHPVAALLVPPLVRLGVRCWRALFDEGLNWGE